MNLRKMNSTATTLLLASACLAGCSGNSTFEPEAPAPINASAEPDATDQGTDNQGADNQGTDNQGTDSQGTDSQGTDNQDTDSQGTDSQGTDNQGADSQGADSQGADSQGADSENGSDNQSTDSQGGGDSQNGDTGAEPGDSPTTEPTLAPALATCSASAAEMRSAMLAAINQSRAEARQCGATTFAAAAALNWDSRLADAAQQHSADMANNNFFSHTGSDGLSVADRADNAGFDWRAIGENIASGQQSVAEVHEDWLQSPGHCANIMAQQFASVGASCVSASNSQYGTYWTVVFGR